LRLRWVLMAILAAGALYFALFGGDYGYFEVRRLEAEQLAEEQRLQALRAQVQRLRARTDSLQSDPATIERVAREKFGLIRDGERLYRFVDSVTTDSATRGKK
jgi:cell division protein FtsB